MGSLCEWKGTQSASQLAAPSAWDGHANGAFDFRCSRFEALQTGFQQVAKT